MSTAIHSDVQAENVKGATSFLRALRGNGPWTLCSIDPKTNAIDGATFRTKDEIGGMQKWIAARYDRRNLYYVPNPTRKRIGKKPTEADIASYQFAHVDCDPLDGETPAEAQERHRANLEAHDPPPTMTYSSGNGIVALWRLAEPVKLESKSDIAACKAINVGIIKSLGGKAEGYDNCQSLDHLLRLPLSPNIPDKRKLAKGRKREMAGDVELHKDRTYTPTDLPAADAPSIAPEPAEIGEAVVIDDLDELPTSDRVKEIIRDGRIEFEAKEGDDSPSAWRFDAMCSMFRDGIPDEVILGLLTDERYAISKRGNGSIIEEAFARKEIARAHSKMPDPADDFPDDIEAKEPGKTNRFKAMKLSELMKLPDPKWLIEDLLTENCLFEIFGQFKAGKTFYGMELGLCVATGLDFFGAKATKGMVIYVIAEGNRKLFGYRVQEWINERSKNNPELRQQLERDVEINFHTLGFAVHMDIENDVKGFMKANPGKRAAIFIDTLMRNMIGDPLKPQDMMKFVRGCDAIRKATEAAVIFLHHMKRDNGSGGFGSIVGEASVDGAAIVIRKSDERIFKLKIMRDADDNLPAWICRIEPRNILVSMSDEGEVVKKSAVLVFDRRGQDDPLQRLLVHIHETNPKKLADLVASFGGKTRTLQRHLSKLRKDGYVVEQGLKLTASGLESAKLAAESDDGDDIDFG